jgi:hypothetical protein
MEELVNQVRASAAARHRGVAKVRVASRELLEANQQAGGARRETLADKARAQGAGLAAQREGRIRRARALKTALGRAGQQRRAVSEAGCAGMRRRLEHLHGDRVRNAARTRTSVRGEVGEIRAAVGDLRGRVQAAMGAIARDVAEAGRLWRTTGPARRA